MNGSSVCLVNNMDDLCRAEDLMKGGGAHVLGRLLLEHLEAYLFERLDFSRKSILGKEDGDSQASLKIRPMPLQVTASSTGFSSW